MNENRPAWERKLDREYIWKKVTAVLVILGIAGMLLLLLYHIPIVTDYNKTFTGYELHYNPETDPTYENPIVAKESTVRFEGKLYRYMFRTDYFDGLVYFDDFTTLPNSKYVISDTTQVFYSAKDVWLSAVVNPLWGPEIKRGMNERIYWAFVNFDKDNELFAFNISIGNEADGGWSLTDNYIVVPAETPEEAAEMYHERIWQMMQDDIEKARKDQTIEPVKTIEGNLKTYYDDKSNDKNTLSTETGAMAVTTTNDNILETFGDIQYTCDLSVFPTDDIRNWFGKIILIEDDKLLVSPGNDAGKAEFGEVAWLICDEAFAYSIGQVVTFTFCDIKAPDKEGEPLTIIALSVYME